MMSGLGSKFGGKSGGGGLFSKVSSYMATHTTQLFQHERNYSILIPSNINQLESAVGNMVSGGGSLFMNRVVGPGRVGLQSMT